MRNPWLELPSESPYILDEDLPLVVAHNRKRVALAQPDGFINDEVLPEPFIGNPESATVVLLNLNPGDGPGNLEAHADPGFRRALIRNLQHKIRDYAFYALNPAFAWTPCAQYWTQHLHELFDPTIGGLDRATVASRLCVIEWFPYHSVGGKGLPKFRFCPSQDYSFELAKNALGKKLVVGMRARDRWTVVDSRFADVPFLSNPQNCHVSVGNASRGLFDRIVTALQ